MADITTQPIWSDGIRIIDRDDPVQGGEGGIDNIPHQQLANRTAYLKREVEKTRGKIDEGVSIESLLKRIESLEDDRDTKVNEVVWINQHFRTAEEFAAHKGYGIWVRVLQGRVPVGFSEINEHPDVFKTFGAEYGEFEHVLTVDEMPSHKHSQDDVFDKFSSQASESGKQTQGSGDYSQTIDEYATGDMTAEDWLKATEVTAGQGMAHNNQPPSLTLDCWQRTT